MSDEVVTEVQGRALVIRLNRPEASNAVNSAMARGLLDAVERLDGDPALTVGVLLGNGPGFSSGMDVKEFAKSGAPRGFLGLLKKGAEKPLVAGVEGFAMGGGLELALVCDLIVAARDVKVAASEVRLGLFAAGGALLRLPRRVPYSVAMRLALTGESISAEEAQSWGLFTEVVEPGAAEAAALALAERIGANAPLAVRATTQLIRGQQGLTEDEYWKLQSGYLDVFASADAKEGARAFAERRTPQWSGC